LLVRFDTAQKHHAKLRIKFDKINRTYMQAKETVEVLSKKQADIQLSVEDRTKLVEKTNRITMARDQNLFECRQRLHRLKEDIPRYKSGMLETFTFCQDVEQKRIEFLKQSLELYVHALELGVGPASVETAACAIALVNSDADVVQYGERYGDCMPLVIPQLDSDGTDSITVLTIASSYVPLPHIRNSDALVHQHKVHIVPPSWLPSSSLPPPFRLTTPFPQCLCETQRYHVYNREQPAHEPHEHRRELGR
jgi:hypothetical protein